MQLETLRLYCHVAQTRSVSRGARETGITQPAASQAIKQLEATMGVRLLDRTKRPLRVTEEGQLFLMGALQVLERYDRLVQRVKESDQQMQGVVRVATIYSVGLYGMKPILDGFRSYHPLAQVEHEVMGGRKVVRAVEDESADLGILSYPRETRTLRLIQLAPQPMVMVCRRDHRLARRKRPVTASELDGARFHAYEGGLPIRKSIDAFLKEHRVKVSVDMEIDNTETLKQALHVVGGVSILPAPSVRVEQRMGTLVTRPLGFGELTRPIGVLYRRRRRVSPLVNEFLRKLQERPDLWA